MLRTATVPFGDAAVAPASEIRPVAARGIKLWRRERVLLDIDEFFVTGGGITAMLGPNGAGKSLLLKCLAGLVAPDAGTVTWAGSPPDRQRAARLGFVFQKPVMLRRSAHANIRHALRVTGVSRQLAVEQADAALAEAGLSHLAAMPARLLSGGEQQRLAIARAMALQPECLFLDEPTANLDPTSMAAIEAMAVNASQRGVKVVLVTHNRGQAERIATDVVFLHGGRIVEQSDVRRFFAAPATSAAAAFLAGDVHLA